MTGALYGVIFGGKMKKAVFFDIDGTLITEDEKRLLPDSTVSAIRKARENGNYMFVNTGRTVFNIEDKITNIGFDGYLCGCGTYIEFRGTELMYKQVDKKICLEIAETMRKCNAAPVYERRDCLFFDEYFLDTEQITDFRENFLNDKVTDEHRTTDDDFSFDKFVCFTNEKTDMDEFYAVTEKYFSIIDRGNGFFENVPLGYSKATAIEYILEKLGIPLENAYAIGDSSNDLPMLTAVPNSIAMGNAVKIYPYVSFITKPILDGGVEYALEHFGII